MGEVKDRFMGRGIGLMKEKGRGWNRGEGFKEQAVRLAGEGSLVAWAAGIWVATGGSLGVGWVNASEAKGLRDYH